MLVSVLKNKSSNLTQGSKIGITIFVLENDINAKRDQVTEKKNIVLFVTDLKQGNNTYGRTLFSVRFVL